MAQSLNKNTFDTVYKDDFIDSDNYYRILFNSGKKLQARELTQSQTIIQNQIKRFGSNIFKDNSLVKGGEADIDNAYEFIRLNVATYPVANPQNLLGYTFTGKTSLVEFKITKVVEAAGADPLTLYGVYTSTKNSSASTTDQIRAQADELMENVSFADIQVENSASCVGVGSRFMCGEAIYYTKGFFVFTEAQDIVISKYTTNPTATIGYKRTEQTVSSDDYSALYDNQGAEPNVTAPGADRYKITLSLINKSALAASENFIPRVDIQNGIITSSAQIINAYNVPNTLIATRIHENSGDYLVKPFGLSFDKDSQNTHLLAKVSDGIAVVEGYRSTRMTGNGALRIEKATQTISYEDQLVAAPYSNYFELDSVEGMAPDMRSGIGFQQQTLRDGVDFTGTDVGTCYIRQIEAASGGKWNAYAFNIILNTGKSISDIKSVGSLGPSNGVVASRYFNVNANSQANGPFNITNEINSLIFPLPLSRPSDILNADYTVQKQKDITPSSSTYILNTSGSETFLDANQWLVTDSAGASGVSRGGDVDSASNSAFGITLGGGNTQATITGLNTGNLTRLTYFARKPNMVSRNKVLTTVNALYSLDSNGGTDPANQGQYRFIDLQVPDIYDVTHIEDATDSAVNWSSYFSVDNGQRDNYYGNGKLISAGMSDSQAGIMAGASAVRVRYQYFQHQAGTSFFSKNSYNAQVDYKDIPRHTFSNGVTIDLADCLDFRPTVDTSGSFTVSSGATINELPKPNGIIDLNVDYFVPRLDKLTIDKNGNVKYNVGISSPNPVCPKTPDGEMHLFDIRLNANTLDKNDLSITKIDHKRYTMGQINLLEKRLGRLEEVTTLSLLEAKADTLLVLDAGGDIRLKSGFVVDNYKNHSFSSLGNPDYRASIDLASGIIYPKKSENSIDLYYDSTSNNPVGNPMKIMGGFVVPKFDREIYLENEYVSNQMLVNPFQVNSYVGTIELFPSSDTWYETAYLGSPAITHTGSQLSTNSAHNWNNHEWNWKGKNLDELQAGDTTNSSASTSGRTTTTSWNVVDQISVNEVYTGDTLISSVTINKMRSKNIRFRATGMRPNAKLFAFFADISIDAWVKGETFATGFESAFNSDPSYGTSEVGATQNPNGISQLESDADGICEGSFFLPTGVFDCGTVKFELRDVSGEGNENWLCRGVTNYTAQGTLQTFQKNYTSTRIIHIEGDQSSYTAPKQDDDGGGGTSWPSAKTDNDDKKGSSGGGNSTYTGGTCGPKNYSKKNNNSGKGHSSQTIGQMPVSESFSAPASDYSNTSFGTSSGGSITVAEIDAMNTSIWGPW